MNPIADIGNTYSASMYLFLAFLLRERYEALGEGIVGKRLLLACYGSGNTMIVLSGIVAPASPQVIESWDLERVFTSARQTAIEDYLVWTAGPYAAGDSATVSTTSQQTPEIGFRKEKHLSICAEPVLG